MVSDCSWQLAVGGEVEKEEVSRGTLTIANISILCVKCCARRY